MPEFIYKQRVTTDAYRDGIDRVFGKKEEFYCYDKTKDWGECDHQCDTCEDIDPKNTPE